MLIIKTSSGAIHFIIVQNSSQFSLSKNKPHLTYLLHKQTISKGILILFEKLKVIANFL